MTQDLNYRLYSPNFGAMASFRAKQKNSVSQILTKPIDKVENVVGDAVDVFVPADKQNEEQKKSNKNAIRAGSAMLVVGGLVALLNPKFLSKWSAKLKVAAAKAGNKAKQDNSAWGKTLKFGETVFDKTGNFLNYSNNFNSVKDEFFKWLCTDKKTFKKIKWEPLRKVFTTIDSAFVKVMKGVHEWITKTFDKISKSTVIRKYKKANSSMNSFNETLLQYRSRLNTEEQKAFDKKLKEIKNIQEFLNESKVSERLANQETLMADFEQKTVSKIKEYGGNAWDSVRHLNFGKDKQQYFRDNMKFWAGDILAPTKEQISAEGKRTVESLVGNGKSQKGAYDELYELIESHLKPEEKSVIKSASKKLEQKLRSANKSECLEYFDKKRDLILGSAPTDILTAVIGIIGSGIAIGMADNKEDRVSRAVSGGIPVIAGLGVSMGMTAMLVSGVKGLLAGFASTIALGKLGSYIDKKFIPKPNKIANTETQTDKTKEIKNA